MSSDKKNSETKGIKAIIIIEVLGKPPEHLTEILDKIATDIDNEKGVQVLNKKVNEPKLLENQKEFYTNFSEIEVEVEDMLYLAVLMFKYMPAHIEVVEPELIALTNGGWTDILSELTRRLHGYDEVARVMQFQNMQMQNKLKELMPPEGKTNDNGKNIPKKSKKSKKK